MSGKFPHRLTNETLEPTQIGIGRCRRANHLRGSPGRRSRRPSSEKVGDAGQSFLVVRASGPLPCPSHLFRRKPAGAQLLKVCEQVLTLTRPFTAKQEHPPTVGLPHDSLPQKMFIFEREDLWSDLDGEWRLLNR